MSSETLHAQLARAEAEGDHSQALRLSAEALRLESADHRARYALGCALGNLGKVEHAVAVLKAASRAYAAAGFGLSAIRALHVARSLSDDSSVTAMLGKLYDRIRPGSRATMPPPPPPSMLPIGDSGSLLELEDEGQLVERAAALGIVFDAPDEAAALSVPLFSEVSKEAFVELVARLALRRAREGETLMTEGASDRSLFVLVSGRVEVSRGAGKDAVRLATLGPGALIGEMALITDRNRTATVTCTEASEAFEIREADIEAVAATHPALTEELVQFARRRLLMNLMNSSPIFKPFAAEQRLELLKHFSSMVVDAGQTIIEEGAEPTGLYLVASGDVEIRKVDESGDAVVLAHLGSSDVFGEIGLLEGTATTATATAADKSVLLFLDRNHFGELADAHPEVKTYLEGLSGERLQEAKDAMDGEALDADDLIII